MSEKVKTKTHSLKPMFLLSLLTNKDSYNTQIIHNEPWKTWHFIFD